MSYSKIAPGNIFRRYTYYITYENKYIISKNIHKIEKFTKSS